MADQPAVDLAQPGTIQSGVDTSLSASPRITLTEASSEPSVLTVSVGIEVTWYNSTAQGHILQFGEPLEPPGYTIYLPLILHQSGGASGLALEPVARPETGHGGTKPAESGGVGRISESAPPLDRTVATTLISAAQFLYSGDNPIQTGVAPGTIHPVRVTVVRGRVLDRESNPLPGVEITILNHPEFGQTRSWEDGMFDMAVNGGGVLTIKYEKDGYLLTQRQLDTPWQDYMWAPDMVFIPPDPQVTAIDLTEPVEIRVARGSVITDEDGTRQATLLFPPNTHAVMTFSEGSARAQATLSAMNVRLTEYTVDEDGPEAMPAELQAGSGYTYTVEFSADEAMAAGATDVEFDQPLFFYAEDLIGFPVGSAVPTGWYDKETGEWIASENGRVVEVLSITGGLADLDTDGDGVADNGAVITPTMVLTITTAEREKLATL